jgi:hypothetical protein
MLLRGGRSAVLSGDAAPRHAIVAYALGCIRVYRAQKDEAAQEPEHDDNVSHMMSPTRSMAAISMGPSRLLSQLRSGCKTGETAPQLARRARLRAPGAFLSRPEMPPKAVRRSGFEPHTMQSLDDQISAEMRSAPWLTIAEATARVEAARDAAQRVADRKRRAGNPQ